MRLEVLVRSRSRVGEGPHWDANNGVLLWVDILAGQFMSTDECSGKTDSISLPTLVGAVVPQQHGGWIVACREGFGTLSPAGQFAITHPILPNGHRMNDAKCDARGRLWAGSTTMAFDSGSGALHVLSDQQHRVVRTGLTLPNGIGWSPNNDQMYLVDTRTSEIYCYEFNLEDGNLGERTVLYRLAGDEGGGVLDGLCVDDEGCLWVAVWGGSRILRLSPQGDLLMVLPVPAAQPSSCAFGGKHGDRLFITSASEGLMRSADALDGSVFVVDGLGVGGPAGQAYGPGA